MSDSFQLRFTPIITVLIGLLLILKISLSVNMSLFGDEAFYWLESTRPAIGYSDLPPLTAWLIGLGTALFGHGYIAVRSIYLVLGLALPIAIYLMAREVTDRPLSVAAALLSLSLPLVATQGLMALPDVPLNLIAVVALITALRAIRANSPAWWSLFGVCAALGLATHFRMFIPLAAVAGYLLFSARALLRGPGPWLAAGIALLGLLPTLLFNLQHDFAALRFQFADRHPWAFQPEGLLQPLQQALVTTPLLYGLLIVAAVLLVKRARKEGGAWTLLAWAGLFPPLFYFFAGLFTDQIRVNFHWPLIGYLPLCILLPDALGALRARLRLRFSRQLAWGLTVVGPILGVGAAFGLMVYLLQAVTSEDFKAPSARTYPDNLLGWKEAASVVRELTADRETGATLVADNFMLAAELSFELGQVPVYSLDHPLNVKHGRATQLAIWGLDETGWLQQKSTDSLLVMESSAVEAADYPAWLHRNCHLLGGWNLEKELSLHAGRKRFLFLRQGPAATGECDFPAISYFDEPAAGKLVGDEFVVSGWAFEDNQGVVSVEVLIDGQSAGMANYGLSRPGVQDFFPQSTDPEHPRVGFELTLDSSRYSNGWRELSVLVRARDGGLHPSSPIAVRIQN